MKEETQKSAFAQREAGCAQEVSIREVSEEPREDHPSLKREDVSNEALLEKFVPRKLKTSSVVASSVALAVISLWLYAAQFQPDAFVFDGESFAKLTVFQDVSFAAFLVALALPLVLTSISARDWFKAGTILLGALPVWVCCYMAAAMAHAPALALVVMTFVAHALFGLSLGMAFCNWLRFFVRFPSDISLQIGLATVLSALGGLALFALPAPIKSLVVTLLPLLIMATLFHLRTVACGFCDDSGSDIAEGAGRSPVKADRGIMASRNPVKADAGLMASLAVVGLIYGCCFGFVISDYPVMQLCAIACSAAMIVLGAVVTVYFLKTGKNLGYTMQSVTLLALVTAGQGLLAIFESDYLPFTFSVVFVGRLLFEMVLLLQLPRVYARTRTLRIFFAMLLVFFGCQFVGSIFRNLLATGLPAVAFRGCSAVLLCLAIGVMAFTLRDNSVSTAWGLLPIPSYPRKKYARACELIKEQYSLTPRETEIMTMVGRGRNGTFIQEKLLISKSTYQTHMRNLYKKLDIHSDQELIDRIEYALDVLKEQ